MKTVEALRAGPARRSDRGDQRSLPWIRIVNVAKGAS